ncbi:MULTISPECIES: DUF1361 domain-containing protein [Enterococcaceae]|uniref:DUF1361 domain-containing protein n=1 Tax=Enterococcaceae TaxID=81852 RepID=UPI001F25FB97|nr:MULTISPECIES: DUF1361 domain-containing protein [Enterococcaceae]UNM90383.1 DUF1361 domain-containing protein [Vagococcus sp. CY52-2]
MKNMVRLMSLLFIIGAYNTRFSFLSLNILLAYIPLELSFQFFRVKKNSLKIGLAALFMLYFPNIPYLVTDMIHMDILDIYNYFTGDSIKNLGDWTLTVVLFLAVFSFVLIGFGQLLKLLNYIKNRYTLNMTQVSLILIVVCLLSSLGIYAGRFPPRFHSIDIFVRPWYVFKTIFLNWSLVKLEIVVLFLILHLAIVGVMTMNKQLSTLN